MTTRRWTLVVGVAAVLFAVGGELARRRETFQRRARELALKAEIDEMVRALLRMGPSDPREVEQAGKRVEFHDRLRLKYERAALYPWMPVAPDPPEPE
jgi:hypothetical protein